MSELKTELVIENGHLRSMTQEEYERYAKKEQEKFNEQLDTVSDPTPEEQSLLDETHELGDKAEDVILENQRRVEDTRKAVESVTLETSNMVKGDILYQNNLDNLEKNVEEKSIKADNVIETNVVLLRKDFDAIMNEIEELKARANRSPKEVVRDNVKTFVVGSAGLIADGVTAAYEAIKGAYDAIRDEKNKFFTDIKNDIKEYRETVRADKDNARESLEKAEEQLESRKMFPESQKETVNERKAERTEIRKDNIDAAQQRIDARKEESHKGILSKLYNAKANHVDEKIIRKENRAQTIDNIGNGAYNKISSVLSKINDKLESAETALRQVGKNLTTKIMPPIYAGLSNVTKSLENYAEKNEINLSNDVQEKSDNTLEQDDVTKE